MNILEDVTKFGNRIQALSLPQTLMVFVYVFLQTHFVEDLQCLLVVNKET